MARPRTASLQPDKMIDLGKEMVQWVSINKPIHLSHWYTRQKHILYSDWRAYRQIPEFLPYYEEALSIVSDHYLDGTIDKSIAQRFLRIYFRDLKEEEDETAKYNSDLKSQETQIYSQDDIDRAKRILDQVSKNQSARNMDCNNINAETKS